MERGSVDCHCHTSARGFHEDLDDVIKRTTNVRPGYRPWLQLQRRSGSLTEFSNSKTEARRIPSPGRACGALRWTRLLPPPAFAVVVLGVDADFNPPVILPSYPDLVAPCFGLHPLQDGGSPGRKRSVKLQDLESAVPLFYKHAPRLTAIGEIGLDFTPWCAPTQQDRDGQAAVFVAQLDIAKELDLPVNVHSRSAAKVTVATMRERGISRALLHNFAGKPSVALEGVQAGYLFSFPPAVCRNSQRDKLIKQLPLEHICLETDSPALGPRRQERNEPSNIALSCQYIADVKGLSPQTVQHATTLNAERLFFKAERR